MYWINILKNEIAKSNQSQVARRLDLSKATISQVLSGTYAGKTDRVKEKVLLEFENKQVSCPLLGLISLKACKENQDKDFSCNNMNSIKLFKACKKCKQNTRVEIC